MIILLIFFTVIARHKDLVNYRTKQNCRRCFLCIFFKCFIHIEIVSLLRMRRKIDLLCFTSSNLSLNQTNNWYVDVWLDVQRWRCTVHRSTVLPVAPHHRSTGETGERCHRCLVSPVHRSTGSPWPVDRWPPFHQPIRQTVIYCYLF